MYEEVGFRTLLAFIAAFGMIAFIIGLVFHVLKSIGLYKLASNKGIENAWLAWIPIGDLYIMAKIIETLSIGDWEVPSIELFLPLGSIIAAALTWIPIIGWLLPIAYAVLYFFALHKLYKMYRPDSATLYLVLSIIFAFLMPIFIFIMRNDSPLEEI